MVKRRSLRALTVAALMYALVAVAHAGAASAKTVWLCKPGHHPDPCTPNLSTTIYDGALTTPLRVIHPRRQRKPPIDCFYVYPTVSDETTGNSDLKIQSTERSIALYQVSRYSQSTAGSTRRCTARSRSRARASPARAPRPPSRTRRSASRT